MRSYILGSAVAVLLSVGLAGCQTGDKPVANPYLPDAITTSLGSTVEYNKLCQSTGVKAPAGCKRASQTNMDAERAAAAITKLNANTQSVTAGANGAATSGQ